MNNTEDATARKWSIDWTNSLFLLGYHLLLLALLPYYIIVADASASLIWGTVALGALCLLAITMGYHRLYAHKTYKVHPAIEAVLGFWGTLATEGSIFSWAHDHRMHHRHVDSELDPYSAPDGFWHSHMLWMLKKRPELNKRVIHDLIERPALQFQSKYYQYLMVAANAIAFLGLWAFTGDLLGSFVVGTLVRMFFVHHCTWFINSLAHMWGSKPYSTEHTSVNNFVLSFFTFGEGYHNYHHTFAGDYRNGVRWYQFDPPKYVIWFLSKLGLAYDLKKVNHLTIKRKLVAADRHLMMARIQELSHKIDHEAWMQRIEDAATSLTQNLNILKTASDKYQRMKDLRDEEVELLQAKIADLKKRVSQEMDAWTTMVRFVMKSSDASFALALS